MAIAYWADFRMRTTRCCSRISSLCRWLLQAQDATGSETLNLTQELLSHMLGVRRTSVSGSANKLQEAGLISYKRGVIKILDRKGLENESCECYAAVRAAIAEAMPKG